MRDKKAGACAASYPVFTCSSINSFKNHLSAPPIATSDVGLHIRLKTGWRLNHKVFCARGKEMGLRKRTCKSAGLQEGCLITRVTLTRKSREIPYEMPVQIWLHDPAAACSQHPCVCSGDECRSRVRFSSQSISQIRWQPVGDGKQCRRPAWHRHI